MSDNSHISHSIQKNSIFRKGSISDQDKLSENDKIIKLIKH